MINQSILWLSIVSLWYQLCILFKHEQLQYGSDRKPFNFDYQMGGVFCINWPNYFHWFSSQWFQNLCPIPTNLGEGNSPHPVSHIVTLKYLQLCNSKNYCKHNYNDYNYIIISLMHKNKLVIILKFQNTSRFIIIIFIVFKK